MVGKLPEWNDWTIDIRLKQFRKIDSSNNILFISFDSDKGRAIFKEYCQDQYNSFIENAEGYQRIVFDIESKCFTSEDAEHLVSDMCLEVSK